ncbi:transmembrane anchor protein [Alteraurantiacibacter buctensis]|uniref:Transmembrane anchor protein n=1 Tax=Alteraurantiacibacter buctensis TaxID=1503981 RepID=A0A844YT86_9SPHN|nr:transmembrane anchor protein [Alteraurantiacibacter buctensis]MXO70270.1 transmembrane anchor protein [Alteraurantiacibacter buctensis]
MYNSQRPRLEDLPTTRQLVGATGFAVVAAGAILATVVLPAEYAIDPTGLGRALGFADMGEVKQQLAAEAAADAAAPVGADAAAPVTAQGPTQAAAEIRKDTMSLTLAPNEGAEIKVTMAEGGRLQYRWSVAGGTANFDTHGDPVNAPAGFYHGYGSGRNSTGEEGELVAAFDGKHGWFWRNRSGDTVTITLETEGGYTEIRRVV